jgi:multiple sugar transport system permease protein
MAEPSRRPAGPGVLTHIPLIIGALLVVGPFVWEILTSLKTYEDSIAVPPQIWSWPLHVENYARLLDVVPFGQQMLTSVTFTCVRVAAQVLTCAAAAYAFARLQFPGRDVLFVALLAIQMVPSQIYLLPQYRIIQSLGLLDTVTGLVLPGLVSIFGTFLLRQFFMQLPLELEEAARLDGANVMQIFVRIMLPLTAPGLLALAVLTAIWSWNDLLWPLLVTTSAEDMPLSVGLANLKGAHSTDYPVLMAGAFLATLPMLAVFVVFQRHMIAGVAFTGSKS